MSSQFVLVVTDSRDAATLRSEILPGFSGLTNTLVENQGDAWATCRDIGDYFMGAAVGNKNVNITVQLAVQATGTVTFSSVVATDTVSIGGVTFTGSNTSSGTSQFRTGSGDTVAAASLASVIGQNTTTNKLVTATSQGAVVTITAIQPGTSGNFITLAISAHGSVSGATLTGGSVGAQVVISEGF